MTADAGIWVKVCGFTRREDVLTAVALGVDAVGVVLAESPRRVTATQAALLLAALPARVAKIGVFVDAPLPFIMAAAATIGLDTVQLHGAENPEVATACAAAGLQVIPVVRVSGPESLPSLDDYNQHGHDLFLLDTYVPGKSGGSGCSFDWNLARTAAKYGRIVLAGGLTPENVARAVNVARPWGVDVSSGVEAAPGVKDPAKIDKFLAAVKAVRRPPPSRGDGMDDR